MAGRPTKDVAELNAMCGMGGSLRNRWREYNRQDRVAKARQRRYVKAHDKKRPKCQCEAYPWPHRPGGGLCRWPDPPLERYQRKPGGRPYRKRYAGLLRQIARNNGLNPIRDRAAIAAMMPLVLALAKQLHRRCPKYKYRNIKISEGGVTGYWTTAGPTM